MLTRDEEPSLPTVTVSSFASTASNIRSAGCAPALTVMDCLNSRNPGSTTSRTYCAEFATANLNIPVPFVTPWAMVTPSEDSRLISASGITAPVGSCTVPVSTVAVWPGSEEYPRPSKQEDKSTLRIEDCISRPPHALWEKRGSEEYPRPSKQEDKSTLRIEACISRPPHALWEKRGSEEYPRPSKQEDKSTLR